MLAYTLRYFYMRVARAHTRHGALLHGRHIYYTVHVTLYAYIVYTPFPIKPSRVIYIKKKHRNTRGICICWFKQTLHVQGYDAPCMLPHMGSVLAPSWYDVYRISYNMPGSIQGLHVGVVL